MTKPKINWKRLKVNENITSLHRLDPVGSLEFVEAWHCLRVLVNKGYCITETAAELNVSRAWLYRRLHKWYDQGLVLNL